MGIQNGSIPVGATYAPSGGVATTIKFLTTTVSAKKFFIDDSPASLALRKILFANTADYRASPGTTGGYTPQIQRLEMLIPITLASGDIFFNKCGSYISYHPETSVADRTLLLGLNANTAVDSDFTEYWLHGVLA